MSLAVEITDAILAEISAVVPGVTTRNAITEGWLEPNQVNASDFPFWEGFGVTGEAATIEDGQAAVIYTVSAYGLRGTDEGDAMHADVEAIQNAVAANYSLNGLVIRTFVSAFGVDEVTDHERQTSALMEFSAQVFE